MAVGERVKELRDAKGWSQAELAREVTKRGGKLSQQNVANIELGIVKEPKALIQIARVFDVLPGWLQTGEGLRRLSELRSTAKAALEEPTEEPADAFPLPARPIHLRPAVGVPDLPIFASAAGGPEGAWILGSDPVGWMHRDQRLVGIRDAFACYVVGDSMWPAYEQGNLLLVNPLTPPAAGDDCLLIQETDDGERYALVKRLLRLASSTWTVRQFNPDKTFSLPRRSWQRALLVIGKYNRG